MDEINISSTKHIKIPDTLTKPVAENYTLGARKLKFSQKRHETLNKKLDEILLLLEDIKDPAADKIRSAVYKVFSGPAYEKFGSVQHTDDKDVKIDDPVTSLRNRQEYYLNAMQLSEIMDGMYDLASRSLSPGEMDTLSEVSWTIADYLDVIKEDAKKLVNEIGLGDAADFDTQYRSYTNIRDLINQRKELYPEEPENVEYLERQQELYRRQAAIVQGVQPLQTNQKVFDALRTTLTRIAELEGDSEIGRNAAQSADWMMASINELDPTETQPDKIREAVGALSLQIERRHTLMMETLQKLPDAIRFAETPEKAQALIDSAYSLFDLQDKMVNDLNIMAASGVGIGYFSGRDTLTDFNEKIEHIEKAKGIVSGAAPLQLTQDKLQDFANILNGVKNLYFAARDMEPDNKALNDLAVTFNQYSQRLFFNSFKPNENAANQLLIRHTILYNVLRSDLVGTGLLRFIDETRNPELMERAAELAKQIEPLRKLAAADSELLKSLDIDEYRGPAVFTGENSGHVPNYEPDNRDYDKAVADRKAILQKETKLSADNVQKLKLGLSINADRLDTALRQKEEIQNGTADQIQMMFYDLLDEEDYSNPDIDEMRAALLKSKDDAITEMYKYAEETLREAGITVDKSNPRWYTFPEEEPSMQENQAEKEAPKLSDSTKQTLGIYNMRLDNLNRKKEEIQSGTAEQIDDLYAKLMDTLPEDERNFDLGTEDKREKLKHTTNGTINRTLSGIEEILKAEGFIVDKSNPNWYADIEKNIAPYVPGKQAEEKTQENHASRIAPKQAEMKAAEQKHENPENVNAERPKKPAKANNGRTVQENHASEIESKLSDYAKITLDALTQRIDFLNRKKEEIKSGTAEQINNLYTELMSTLPENKRKLNLSLEDKRNLLLQQKNEGINGALKEAEELLNENGIVVNKRNPRWYAVLGENPLEKTRMGIPMEEIKPPTAEEDREATKKVLDNEARNRAEKLAADPGLSDEQKMLAFGALYAQDNLLHGIADGLRQNDPGNKLEGLVAAAVLSTMRYQQYVKDGYNLDKNKAKQLLDAKNVRKSIKTIRENGLASAVAEELRDVDIKEISFDPQKSLMSAINRAVEKSYFADKAKETGDIMKDNLKDQPQLDANIKNASQDKLDDLKSYENPVRSDMSGDSMSSEEANRTLKKLNPKNTEKKNSGHVLGGK